MIARRFVAWACAATAAVAIGRVAGVAADGQPPVTLGRTITPETLPVVLVKQAGMSLPVDGGAPGRLRIERGPGGGNIFAFLSLSLNGQYIWITAPLATLPQEQAERRRHLLAMLSANAEDDGVHFGLAGDEIQSPRAVDNREAISPPAFGREIDGFFRVMIKTNLLWNVTKWGDAGAAQPSTTKPPSLLCLRRLGLRRPERRRPSSVPPRAAGDVGGALTMRPLSLPGPVRLLGSVALLTSVFLLAAGAFPRARRRTGPQRPAGKRPRAGRDRGARRRAGGQLPGAAARARRPRFRGRAPGLHDDELPCRYRDGSNLNVLAPLRAWKDDSVGARGGPPRPPARDDRASADARLRPPDARRRPVGGADPVPLDNRDLRPANVREQIDFLFEHVRRTEPLWNPYRLPVPARPRTGPAGMDAAGMDAQRAWMPRAWTEGTESTPK